MVKVSPGPRKGKGKAKVPAKKAKRKGPANNPKPNGKGKGRKKDFGVAVYLVKPRKKLQDTVTVLHCDDALVKDFPSGVQTEGVDEVIPPATLEAMRNKLLAKDASNDPEYRFEVTKEYTHDAIFADFATVFGTNVSEEGTEGKTITASVHILDMFFFA